MKDKKNDKQLELPDSSRLVRRQFHQGVRIEGGETLVLIFDATFHNDSSLPIGLSFYQL